MIGNFLSVKEAAAKLGCTEGRIHQLIKEGKLEKEYFNERAVAIPAKSVEKYAKNPITVGRKRIGADR